MSDKKEKGPNERTSAPLTPWEKAQLERKQQEERWHFKPFQKKRIGNKLPELVALRHKRLRRALLLNLSGFTILLLLSLYFISPLSKITKIEVSGTSTPLAQQVVNFSGVKPGQYLLGVIFERRQITKQLQQKVPEVRHADFAISGRNVKVKLKFYQNLGYVAKNKQFYRVAPSGKISHLAHSYPQGNTPIYVDFNNQQLLKEMAKQMEQLSPKIIRAISEIHATPTKADWQKLHLYMNDGNQVLATASTFARKMKYYPEIKAQTSGKVMIDIQVGAFSYQLN
ncbi:cell division protein FtsQ/DivIB [Liquorilactobacillus ghanensis]|uniref:cell division protein FtsQ/DivIB n=1 Tax=Liquorilactobacillus ghanensis TaxID=399370 RepID=UPI0039E9FBAB